jgi:hypothetical protein
MTTFGCFNILQAEIGLAVDFSHGITDASLQRYKIIGNLFNIRVAGHFLKTLFNEDEPYRI